jgi:hypothetical protein
MHIHQHHVRRTFPNTLQYAPSKHTAICTFTNTLQYAPSQHQAICTFTNTLQYVPIPTPCNMYLYHQPAICTFTNILQYAPSPTPCNMYLYQHPVVCTFTTPCNMHLHNTLQNAPSPTPCNMYLYQHPAICTFTTPCNMHLHNTLQYAPSPTSQWECQIQQDKEASEFNKTVEIRWQAEQLLASFVWQLYEVKRPHSYNASEGRFPWRHADGESCASIPSSTTGGQIPTAQGLLDNNRPSVGQEFLPFMEHKSSFRCSQQQTTPRYRQPREPTETHSSLVCISKWSLPAVLSLV